MKPRDVAMARPCADCPFRVEGAIELAPGRVESILAGLLADDMQGFICHEAYYAKRRRLRLQCAGSMAVLLKAGQPNVVMRFGAALGLIDFEKLRALAHEVIDPPTQGGRP
jgi:hypothetical protein